MVILDEIKLKENVKLVIQRRQIGGKTYIDIRKWVKTKRYTGFTKKGIAIEPEFLPQLIESLQRVKI